MTLQFSFFSLCLNDSMFLIVILINNVYFSNLCVFSKSCFNE